MLEGSKWDMRAHGLRHWSWGRQRKFKSLGDVLCIPSYIPDGPWFGIGPEKKVRHVSWPCSDEGWFGEGVPCIWLALLVAAERLTWIGITRAILRPAWRHVTSRFALLPAWLDKIYITSLKLAVTVYTSWGDAGWYPLIESQTLKTRILLET